jgi:ABC-2 type transport system permease protein
MYNFKHSYDRLSDAFYWPVIDLLIWGLTSKYFISLAPDSGLIMTAVLSGLLFWIITWRGQYEITINLLTELWDKNLINLFVAPLKFSEWVASLIVIGILKAFISIVFASVIAYFLYDINILMFGIYLIPFFFLLIMTGWWIGITIAAIILRYGTKIQTLAWTVTWAVAPFSAIYFPVSILPDWAQKIAYIMPSSYIFEGMREIVFTNSLSMEKIWICLVLNVLYVSLSLLFLRNSFQKTLNRGLQSVT